MANEINEIEAGASRINHSVYRDVYNTTFDRDTIEDFEMSPGGELSGMCKTVEYGWLPVFYHCKRHCYTEEVTDLESNDSLNGGVMAFEIGHEVKVLLEKEKSKFVVDHFEQHDPPYMCADLIRLNYTTYQGAVFDMYYVASKGEEYGEFADAGCGVTPKMNRGIILFGQREFVTGTVNYYWTDRYMKVGPVCYIFRISSTLLPGAITFPFNIWKAVWTPELEAECIALGAAAEETIGGAFDPPPRWAIYPEEFVPLPGFENTLNERFVGAGLYGGVRWMHTRMYGQDFEIET